MATIREYFDLDSPKGRWNVGGQKAIQLEQGGQAVNTLPVMFRVVWDELSRTRYYWFYIPACEGDLALAQLAITDPKKITWLVEQLDYKIKVSGGEELRTSQLPYSGSMLLYTERELTADEINALKNVAATVKVTLTHRGPKYAERKSEESRPIAFVSHDSRDKDSVARPLAEGLVKAGLTVWYDEYDLKIGDSLRESIDKGLKECKRCILVLSKHYLSNEGWTKKEFGAVFTRELIERRNIILPVWIDVDRDSVFEYSTELADRMAARWEDGPEKVILQLQTALE